MSENARVRVRESLQRLCDGDCSAKQVVEDALRDLSSGDYGMLLVQWQEGQLGKAKPETEPIVAELIRQMEEEQADLNRTVSVSTVSANSANASAVPFPHLPPVQGYEVLNLLGRGGMGIVYRARQIGLNRMVGLKMIRADVATPKELARFRLEGEAVARLRHPNIIQIYEIGDAEGCPYIAMEYLAGGSLSARNKTAPFPIRQAAEVVEALARGMHHAHLAHVLHRDLKPGNVLLDEDGTPKIADFGLAKLLDGDNSLTATEAILGTIRYMAPEQATGRAIGIATDIYGLGAILYDLLAGQPPIESGPPEVMLERVRTGELITPRRIRPELAADLEAVCLKCLAKDPRQRYESAAALAADLRQWLDGRPTLARPVRGARRLVRWVNRRPWTSAAVALLLVAVFALLGAAYYLHPDRVPRDNLAMLELGQSVTLIGATGPPSWLKPVLGKPAFMDERNADRQFSFMSRFPAYVELFPSAPARPYRFRVKVRHEEKGANAGGEVGIYLLRTAFATAKGTEHAFCVLRFSDWREEGHDEAGKPVGRVALDLRRRRDPGPFGAAINAGVSQAIPLLLPRPGVRPNWHEVVVEVTDELLQVFWDGQHLGTVARQPLEHRFQEYLNSISDTELHEPALTPSFAMTGGLGVFVENGWASFQDAIIEPFDPTPGRQREN